MFKYNETMLRIWLQTKEIIPIVWRKRIKAIFDMCFRSVNQSKYDSTLTINNNDKVILFFSAINFNYRYQRPQRFALACSTYKKHTRNIVFYISHDFLSTKNYEKPPFLVKKIDENLYNLVLSSSYPYFMYVDNVDQLGAKIIEKSLGHFLAHYKIKKKQLTYVFHHPFWANFAFISDKVKKIYDCFDDHGAFGFATPNLLKNEQKLFNNCINIFVTEGLAKKNRIENYTVIRNGVDFVSFQKAYLPKYVKEKTIGYVGAIENWFDTILLEKLLNKFPHNEFILVGLVRNKEIYRLSSIYPNLKLLGEKPAAEIPKLINSFKVCLIPFIVDELKKTTDPIKYYEYLALGKPVVTSNIPILLQYSNLHYQSNSHEDFIVNLKKALNENDVKIIKKRMSFSKNHDWKKVFGKFIKAAC